MATKEDRQNYTEAANYLKKMWNYYEEEKLIPQSEIRPSHRRENMLWHYGTKLWSQFFGERQLLVMLTVIKNIREICKGIEDKEYAKVIATYMAFLLCRHINSNSLGVIWNKGAEKVEHALLTQKAKYGLQFYRN